MPAPMKIPWHTQPVSSMIIRFDMSERARPGKEAAADAPQARTMATRRPENISRMEWVSSRGEQRGGEALPSLYTRELGFLRRGPSSKATTENKHQGEAVIPAAAVAGEERPRLWPAADITVECAKATPQP